MFSYQWTDSALMKGKIYARSNGESSASAGYIVKNLKFPSEYGWVADSWMPIRLRMAYIIRLEYTYATAEGGFENAVNPDGGALPFIHSGRGNILKVAGNVESWSRADILSLNTGTWEVDGILRWKYVPYVMKTK